MYRLTLKDAKQFIGRKTMLLKSTENKGLKNETSIYIYIYIYIICGDTIKCVFRKFVFLETAQYRILLHSSIHIRVYIYILANNKSFY